MIWADALTYLVCLYICKRSIGLCAFLTNPKIKYNWNKRRKKSNYANVTDLEQNQRHPSSVRKIHYIDCRTHSGQFKHMQIRCGCEWLSSYDSETPKICFYIRIGVFWNIPWSMCDAHTHIHCKHGKIVIFLVLHSDRMMNIRPLQTSNKIYDRQCLEWYQITIATEIKQRTCCFWL